MNNRRLCLTAPAAVWQNASNEEELVMRRTMRRAFTVVCSLLATAPLLIPNTVFAATPPPPTTISVQQTPPPSTAPPLLITSIAGTALPSFIELYNQGDTPLNLHGWQLHVITQDIAGGCADVHTDVSLPDAWLLSEKYLTLENTAAPAVGGVTVPFFLDPATLLVGCQQPKLASVRLQQGADEPEQAVTITPALWSATATTLAQHKQRNNALSSTRAVTGVFESDYKIVTGASTLNSDPLYTPPDAAGLQIVELLPNAKSCAPLDIDPTCGDYIKLYNPTPQPINLALYRLRSGSKGQSTSITNTFTWNTVLDPTKDELMLMPNAYFMLTLRNDGQPLSLTDTGNYVWLEDAYGTTTYPPIIQYPDASSTTKVGAAWAYTGTDWAWTSTPAPGVANSFPPLPAAPNIAGPVSGASVVTTTLKPCASNQYRNPATNRCDTTAVTTSTLTPCGPGEERNPATNRCRSIAAAPSAPAPCQPGWERNPDTNRCRKVAAVAGAATTAVTDVPSPVSDRAGWAVATIAAAVAIGFAFHEWRQELRLAAIGTSRRIATFIRRR